MVIRFEKISENAYQSAFVFYAKYVKLLDDISDISMMETKITQGRPNAGL